MLDLIMLTSIAVLMYMSKLANQPISPAHGCSPCYRPIRVSTCTSLWHSSRWWRWPFTEKLRSSEPHEARCLHGCAPYTATQPPQSPWRCTTSQHVNGHGGHDAGGGSAAATESLRWGADGEADHAQLEVETIAGCESEEWGQLELVFKLKLMFGNFIKSG